MYLNEENLIIREAVLSDVETLLNWWNDGQLMAYAGFPNGLGISKEAIIEILKDEEEKRLIIEVDEAPIGEMVFKKCDEEEAAIDIKICRFDLQEKGLETRFLKMLIRYLFDELNIERIVTDTNLKNERAQHVYEKIGFQKVAVNFDSWKNQLGELQSSIEYLLNRADFKR